MDVEVKVNSMWPSMCNIQRLCFLLFGPIFRKERKSLSLQGEGRKRNY